MQILVITNNYPTVHSPSGASYITSRLKAIRAAGHQVTTIALCPQYSPPLAQLRRLTKRHASRALQVHPSMTDQYLGAAVPWGLKDLHATRSGRMPTELTARAARKCLEAVRSGHFDVVHAHGMYELPAGGVAARVAKTLSLPFVVTMHGSDVNAVMAARPRAQAEVLHEAAATIYVSDALRRTAADLGAPTAQSHVVSGGVDPNVFHSTASAEHPPNAPRLLFVGNLLPVKGADRLPSLLAEIQRHLPQASLDIVGDGPMRSSIGRRPTPGIRMHGRLDVDAVADLMRRASVLLVPSREEGLGCVILEAYASGVPVVATRVGGIREIIFSADDAVDPGEGFIERMSHQAMELIARPPSADLLLAHAARYNWQSVVDQELAILQSVSR